MLPSFNLFHFEILKTWLTVVVCSEYVRSDSTAPVAYKLVTTTVLRKYSFLFDLPLTAMKFASRIVAAALFPAVHTDPEYRGKALMANTWHRYIKTRDAFASHSSQYSWDRYLYMIISRYVWFNDLERIPGGSISIQ